MHLNQQQPSPQQQQQQNGILVSLDPIESNGHSEPSTSYSLPLTGKSSGNPLQSTRKLLFKNSEIIFENDLLQIGIKIEPMKQTLKVEFYYGNKTSSNLTNLTSTIQLSPELETGKLHRSAVRRERGRFLCSFGLELRIQMEPMPSSVEPKAQIKQRGTIECLKDFQEMPKISVSFL